MKPGRTAGWKQGRQAGEERGAADMKDRSEETID